MPVSGEVPWDKDPHTSAKHEIYRSYLEKWFPILLSDNGYPSVTYAEGFSGPGVYKDGTPGSPIIAIQTLLDTPELRDSRKVTRFVFIDDDRRCIESLKQQLLVRFPERPRSERLMPVLVEQGKCADTFEPALGQLSAWHQPILAVFDSWGNMPVPYGLIRKIAQNPSSEVIATFGPQHFIRFVDQLDDQVDAVFGHDRTWRSIIELADGREKKRFLLGCYRTMLKDAGFQFQLDFELVTRSRESIYLIFGTNHRRGLEKMKESLWSVDRTQGVGFADPKDPETEPLFDLVDPVLGPLERMLLARMETEDQVRVETLREYALFHTVYREQHVIPALQRLRERGGISCDRPRIERAALVRRV
jgi:three-Cys-motif partner protein